MVSGRARSLALGTWVLAWIALATITGLPGDTTVPDPSPRQIAHWSFDDPQPGQDHAAGRELSIDASIGGGYTGQGLDLTPGTGAYTDQTEGLAAHDISVAFWFRPGSWDGDIWDGDLLRIDADHGEPLSLYGGQDGREFVLVRYSSSDRFLSLETGPQEISDGWHHLAAVQHDASWVIYLDGRKIGSQAAIVVPPRNSTGLTVGRSSFNGSIDELRIYRGGLDAGTVRQLAGRTCLIDSRLCHDPLITGKGP